MASATAPKLAAAASLALLFLALLFWDQAAVILTFAAPPIPTASENIPRALPEIPYAVPAESCEAAYRRYGAPHLSNGVLSVATSHVPLAGIVRTLRSMLAAGHPPPRVYLVASRGPGIELGALLAKNRLRGLQVVVFAWEDLITSDAFPAHIRTNATALREVNVVRVFAYGAVVSFLASRGVLYKEAVVYSNVAPADVRLPDALMVADGRDTVFQRDPFAEFWCLAAAQPGDDDGAPGAVSAARSALLKLKFPEDPREIHRSTYALSAIKSRPFDGWAQSRVDALVSGRLLLVASVEAASMTIQQCTYNSMWVRNCFGNTVREEIGKNSILCSGGFVGTGAAVKLLLKGGLIPGTIACAKPLGGADQGIFNAVVSSWRNNDASVANSTIAAISRSMQSQLEIRYARAEDGIYGTVQYLASFGGVAVDSDGWMAAWTNKSVRVAVAHQYDRWKKLEEKYGAEFDDPALRKPKAEDGQKRRRRRL